MIKQGRTQRAKEMWAQLNKGGRVGRTCCLKGECDAVDKWNVWANTEGEGWLTAWMKAIT